jgi:DNA-binding XRE family transcriptional regulator
MTKEELFNIRHYLGKSQNEMARLLGSSLKAIQSFEQGWRSVPMHIERQALFLLHMRRSPDKRYRPCWEIEECPNETRQKCPAWEFQAGHICWFINGTICHGDTQASWKQKMEMCRQCKVFQVIWPVFID